MPTSVSLWASNELHVSKERRSIRKGASLFCARVRLAERNGEVAGDGMWRRSGVAAERRGGGGGCVSWVGCASRDGCVFRGGCVCGCVSGEESGGGCLPTGMRCGLFGGEESGGGAGRRLPARMRGGIFCSAAYCCGTVCREVRWRGCLPAWMRVSGRNGVGGRCRVARSRGTRCRAVGLMCVLGEGSGGCCLPAWMRGGIFCSAAYCRRAGPAPA